MYNVVKIIVNFLNFFFLLIIFVNVTCTVGIQCKGFAALTCSKNIRGFYFNLKSNYLNVTVRKRLIKETVHLFRNTNNTIFMESGILLETQLYYTAQRCSWGSASSEL